MSEIRIPLNRVEVLGDELENLAAAARGGQIAGDGSFTGRVTRLLERLLADGDADDADAADAPRVLLTTSCTHALELAALLLDLQPGDEAVMPSFTFSSTANAFLLHGGRPVFADIRPDTLNLDERALAPHLGPRTRAIVPVHYAGVACEMDSILDLAEEAGATVIEDNAHGLLGRYRGRQLGTLGALSALSFHSTKNFTCGEGGALVVNDPSLLERAEILREKGTDRSRFFRGEVDRYGWRDRGSSYLPSDLLAAFLLAQLERWETVQERRRQIWTRYATELSSWAERIGARLPAVPDHCVPAWHLFHLLLPTEATRDRLSAHLRERGILAVFHYLPLHLSPMGRSLGGHPGQLPVTEDLAGRLLRLPFFTALEEPEQSEVIAAVLDFEG